jgi:hypothetical protein
MGKRGRLCPAPVPAVAQHYHSGCRLVGYAKEVENLTQKISHMA